MSMIKLSKKFIEKGEGIFPGAYVIHKSFHEDYDMFYRWLNSGINLVKEFQDPAIHCVIFSEYDESKFLSLFGENIA